MSRRRAFASVAGSVAVFALLAAACSRPPVSPSLRERGRALASQRGCLSCHSIDGTAKTGPTWKGLFASRVRLADGSVVVAGKAYLRESMLDPDAKTVDGYPRGVMAAAIRPGSLTAAQVDALVAYVKSLK